VRLSLRSLEPPDGYGLVASGDLDLLITHRYPGMPSTPLRGLVRRNVAVEPLRLAVPQSWGTGGGLSAADLVGAAWICGPPGSPDRVCLDVVARQAGLEPRVDYETADYALTLALVGAGLGVALVPAGSMAEAPPHPVAVRDLAGADPAREICVVHRRRPAALLRTLIDLVAQAAARLTG